MAASPTINRRGSVLLALGIGVSGVMLPASAKAQRAVNAATAQALFDEARTLMNRGDYAHACPKLEESQSLDPGGGTLLNLAVCYEHDGRTASAWTTYLDAASAARASGNVDRERASRERATALAHRLARVTIRVTSDVPGLEVRRDGALVRSAQWGTSVPVDPGAHVIVATAPGHAPWQTSVTIRDATAETITVPVLTKAETAASGDDSSVARNATEGKSDGPFETAHSLGVQRVAALATGGLGVAGLVVGTVFGLRSISKRAESDETCAGSSCSDQHGVNLNDEALRAGNVSTIAFIAGGACLAGGLALWFTAPSTPAARIALGPGVLRIEGTW